MCTDERCRHPWTCDCIEQCAERPRRTVTELVALYSRFAAFLGRELPSADEALRDESLDDPMTVAWLIAYVEEWDIAAAWEARCARENEEPWKAELRREAGIEGEGDR